MPTKTVAILQSNYIPWKGYFDIIRRCDAFILFDDVQYTRNDWRNRNKIKTPEGVRWLTIPIKVKGRYTQLIHEAEIQDAGWADEHQKTLLHAYRRARCFDQYYPIISALYVRAAAEIHLSGVNYLFLSTICDIIGIKTPIFWSMDYASAGHKSDKLLDLCLQAGATTYLSGPAARSYMDESIFTQEGIQVAYMDYSGYPEYPQVHPPFEHGVSILDLLFNMGDAAVNYLLPML